MAPLDTFGISSIYLPESTVLCYYHTSYGIILYAHPVPSLAPSSKGLIAATLGVVNLRHSYNTSSFPVIFDSGASLATSLEQSNFVGPIRPIVDQHLSGLTIGLKIKAIDTVHWKFRTKGGVMTVVSSSYYVPLTRARLISP